MIEKTFAQLVDDATSKAILWARPYCPSPAQFEAQLHFVCAAVEEKPDPWAFIRATFRGAGSMDAVALDLFKRRIAQKCAAESRSAQPSREASHD